MDDRGPDETPEAFETRVRSLLKDELEDARRDFKTPDLPRRKMSGRRVAAGSTVAVALMIALFGSVGLMTRDRVAAPSAPAGSAAPSVAGPTASVRVEPTLTTESGARPAWPGRIVATFTSMADALTFDRVRQVVWIVVPQSKGPELLYRYEPGTGDTSRWELPPTTYLGDLAQVLVDDTGAVWVNNDGYRIVRFDPDSETSSSYVFALDVPGVDSANGGTWVSAIAADGDGVVIARHQVPSLVRLTPTLKIAARVAIPPEFAGATGLAVVDGHLFVTERGPDGTIARLAPDGTVEVRFTAMADRLFPTSDGLLATHDLMGHRLDSEVISEDGAVLRNIPPPFRLPPIPVVVTNPLGREVSATIYPTPRALVSDGAGTSWYVVEGESEAVLREYVASP